MSVDVTNSGMASVAQSTVANHQKNYVALNKLHTEAAKHTEPSPRGPMLIGERLFEDTFIAMLARALPIKKGASVVDRIIKFAAGYTKFINEKGACAFMDFMPCSRDRAAAQRWTRSVSNRKSVPLEAKTKTRACRCGISVPGRTREGRSFSGSVRRRSPASRRSEDNCNMHAREAVNKPELAFIVAGVPRREGRKYTHWGCSRWK